MTPQEIAFKVLEGFEPEVLDVYDIGYVCDCCRDRVERALMSIGKAELKKMAEEEEQVEVGCQFCDKKYVFTRHQLKELAK